MKRTGPIVRENGKTVHEPERLDLIVRGGRVVTPEGVLAAPAHPGGLGRFYMIASGRARVTGALLGRLATVFVTPEEEPVQVHAGAEGAEVLVLQFPE